MISRKLLCFFISGKIYDLIICRKYIIEFFICTFLFNVTYRYTYIINFLNLDLIPGARALAPFVSLLWLSLVLSLISPISVLLLF